MKEENQTRTIDAFDEIRGIHVKAVREAGGNLADYGYITTDAGERLFTRIWTKEHILELLRRSDRAYKRLHHVRNLDALIDDLDLLAYNRGIQLDLLFDEIAGNRDWRWTKAERAKIKDSWRYSWEPTDGVVEFGC